MALPLSGWVRRASRAATCSYRTTTKLTKLPSGMNTRLSGPAVGAGAQEVGHPRGLTLSPEWLCLWLGAGGYSSGDRQLASYQATKQKPQVSKQPACRRCYLLSTCAHKTPLKPLATIKQITRLCLVRYIKSRHRGSDRHRGRMPAARKGPRAAGLGPPRCWRRGFPRHAAAARPRRASRPRVTGGAPSRPPS